MAGCGSVPPPSAATHPAPSSPHFRPPLAPFPSPSSPHFCPLLTPFLSPSRPISVPLLAPLPPAIPSSLHPSFPPCLAAPAMPLASSHYSAIPISSPPPLLLPPSSLFLSLSSPSPTCTQPVWSLEPHSSELLCLPDSCSPLVPTHGLCSQIPLDSCWLCVRASVRNAPSLRLAASPPAGAGDAA